MVDIDIDIYHGITLVQPKYHDQFIYGCTMENKPWFDPSWFNNCSTTMVLPWYNHSLQHQHSINCCLSPEVVIIYGRIESYIK